MPFLALLLLNGALGLLASLAAARELRATPRSAVWSDGFRAVAAYQMLVAVPVAAYLLARFTDWAVSYLVDGARIPSVALGLATLAYAAVGLAGFALGAQWLRSHHGQRSLPAAGVLLGAAVLGTVLLRRRLGVVGTATEYRGGFGVLPFGASRAFGACALLGTIQAAAAAHLLVTLRSLGPREE